MLPLISVIVPIYNTESYLDRCVQSILNQSYTNMEIILVDDGSTDSSPQKCDAYAQMDPRIIVIHKKNGGQSNARNVGLDVSHGKYISFIDSDDWIEPNMYSVLLEQLEKYNANLAVSGRYDMYEYSEKMTIGKCLGKNGLYDSYDILPQMILGQLSDFSVCDKLHRRNLWENIRFPEGEIYEDLAVMYKVLIAAKSVVLYDKPFYVYYHRSNSTVTSGFRESLINYPKHTKQLLTDISLWYPEYTNHAIWAHIKAIQFVLIKLLRSDKKTFNEWNYLYKYYVETLKKYSHVWKNDPLFSLIDRLISRILLHKNISHLFFSLKKESNMDKLS